MNNKLLTLLLLVIGAVSSSQLLAAHPLEGIWEQRLFADNHWYSGGLFEVVADDDKLSMQVISTPLDPDLIPSEGLSNVRYQQGRWSFNSDWGDYGIANFQLQRETDNAYVGHAYLNGEQRSPNKWFRIGTLQAKELQAGREATVRQYSAGDKIMVTHTFGIGARGFIASTSSRSDGNLVLLKSVVVEPRRQGAGRQNLTAHWVLDSKSHGPETRYFVDSTVISLTNDELQNMQRLLQNLLKSGQ